MRYSQSAFLQLLSILAASLVLVNYVSGAPTSLAPTSDWPHRKLFARACPTVAEFLAELKAKGLGENTVFYTYPAKSPSAIAFAATLDPPGNSFEDLITPELKSIWIAQCNQVELGQSAADEESFFNPRVSAALAEGATGTAYLMIPDSEDSVVNLKSVWGRIEFPVLQRNPNINLIRRVDPSSPQNSAVIWRGGDSPTLPPATIP